MYKTPQAFINLRKDLKIDLDADGINKKDFAPLVTSVELGLELLRRLNIDDEPIVVLWVILSGSHIRHHHLENLSADQKRAIANCRIILPGYAGRFAWESALRDYIRQIPSKLRIYDFDPSNLDQQIINACWSNQIEKRTTAYTKILDSTLKFKLRNANYAKAGITYDFKAYFNKEEERTLQVQFTAEQAKIAVQPLKWFEHHLRPRQPINIPWTDIEEVARFLENQGDGGNWIHRLKNVDYRHIDNLGERANELNLNGLISLAGMVSSGKSTLMTLIAAHFVYEHRILNQGAPKRITLVVSDSATSISLADRFNRWFCSDPETDSPVAVPLLGRSTRDKHLKQLHEAQEYKQAVHDKRIHWGERFLNPLCPLQGLLQDKLPQPLKVGTEPCRSLKEVPSKEEQKNEKPSTKKKRAPHQCPLFAVCPSQQLYRDIVEAQIWITTPGAMGAGLFPIQLEKRSISFGDLVYEQSDLVVFDEVDVVMEWFDRLYAQEAKLIASGSGSGILDEMDRLTADFWSKQRLLPADTRRWIEAQRSFLNPISHILALLQEHKHLQKSVERGYFTALSLFHRLTRRMLGLKVYEDTRDEKVRQDNEQAVDIIMPIFKELFQANDPLIYPIPPNFRQNRQVDWRKLQTSRNAFEWEKGKVGSQTYTEKRERYQHLLGHLIYQLTNIMTVGDSMQNPAILDRYKAWILQLVPDVEQRLQKLKQELANSEDEREQSYFKEYKVDTLETLAHHLEFAINVTLLDRHTRIVFYEWHNRPEVIDDEKFYNRIPKSLLNILPIPPTGRLFGIYHAGSEGAHKTLSTFGYTNIGRSYITQFHQLRSDIEGQSGPNVLAMSGTSFLPDSSKWHLNVPPQGILKPSGMATAALSDQDTWFRFMPVYDKDKPIRVSGKPDKLPAIKAMVEALVGENTDQGGKLANELNALETLAQNKPEFWADRGRLLLLVNSYEQCQWVAETIKSRWASKAGQVYHLIRPTADHGDTLETGASGQIRRVDVELFGQTDGVILIAPLQAVGRALNILNTNRKAAFGAIYFLTRPMPHPHDIPAIAQEVNRRAMDWYDDETFIAWTQEDGIYQRGLELRHQATEYWRRIEARKYYNQLRDEKDPQHAQDKGRPHLHANPRRDLAATTAGKIIQAVGRLLRGNVPFHAYFVDAAWAPRQAKRLLDPDNPLDTPKTSLLAGVIEVMADYVDDPVGKALYEHLFNKLEQTQNFDWAPI